MQTAHPTGMRRREIIRLVGLGAALGILGTGTAAARGERYIVGTRSRAAVREAQRLARSVHRTLDFGTYGTAVAGTFSEAALRGLARRPDVDYVEPDGLMYAIGIDHGGDTELGNSWGVDRVDAEKAGATGAGAKIAILDTGIDYGHPDLAGNFDDPNGLLGIDYVNDDGDPMDDNGHGTHCAGIAAATGGDSGVVGVAPGASLYGVKVLSASGSGSYSDIAAGLNWAVSNGMDVASMSLGGGQGSTTIENACNNAADNGVFVVAAAGNDGRGRLSYPAKYDSVVAVSASDRTDGIASWSNTGDGLDHAAPGVKITSTVPSGLGIETTTISANGSGEYAAWSGTSMACPHVAGAAALVMAGGLTGTEARSLLASTAEDLGAAGWDKQYGYGLVDAEAAVAGSGGGSTDAAPSASILSPADGATVAGVVTVGVAASDTEDDDTTLDVAITAGGTALAVAYDATSGTYTGDWDTTGAAEDADHAIDATVTDSAGNTSAAPTVTVRVDNTDDAPAVAVTEPTGGSTVGGTVRVAATASDDWTAAVDLAVAYAVDGGTATAMVHEGSGVYAADWDTTAVADGDHTVTVTATDGAGVSSSDAVLVTVDNTVTTGSVPAVDRLVATEAGSPNPHAEVTVDWAVGDADGDLASVTVEGYRRNTDGTRGDRVYGNTTTVGGGSAAAIETFEVKFGGGATYEVLVTVVDGTALSGSATTTVAAA